MGTKSSVLFLDRTHRVLAPRESRSLSASQKRSLHQNLYQWAKQDCKLRQMVGQNKGPIMFPPRQIQQQGRLVASLRKAVYELRGVGVRQDERWPLKH